MSAYDRRLERIDRALWDRAELTPEAEAMMRTLADRHGIPAGELRAEAIRIARTYGDRSAEDIAAALAVERGCTAAEILAEAAALETEVQP